MGMGRKARVGRLEEKIQGPERREPFDWEAAYGEIGVLTMDCVVLFLTDTEQEHAHQLLIMGSFALNHLTGARTVSNEEREYVRRLIGDPYYRGFGATKEKHPKALQLYRMCEVRGWLDSRDPAMH
jgi:hypothetical protein